MQLKGRNLKWKDVGCEKSALKQRHGRGEGVGEEQVSMGRVQKAVRRASGRRLELQPGIG